ncbi:hypothetical protein Lmor_1971 [Legionella moravica]|uniref:Uncharacterized protein n=1 Tax=Legionella moravica TaxID=39962 RepID=A0A378JYP1_9GAMM|nr:hypothetical protein [Legionella moravica]KTD33659.1 hypothetical protein Lmor_1971 [Legionella moravica]STX62592.1 Uncharacterised protein [Legionella moravica]
MITNLKIIHLLTKYQAIPSEYEPSISIASTQRFDEEARTTYAFFTKLTQEDFPAPATVLKNKIHFWLAKRWVCVRNTVLDYRVTPSLPVNQFCLELAEMTADSDMAAYHILMPYNRSFHPFDYDTRYLLAHFVDYMQPIYTQDEIADRLAPHIYSFLDLKCLDEDPLLLKEVIERVVPRLNNLSDITESFWVMRYLSQEVQCQFIEATFDRWFDERKRDLSQYIRVPTKEWSVDVTVLFRTLLIDKIAEKTLTASACLSEINSLKQYTYISEETEIITAFLTKLQPRLPELFQDINSVDDLLITASRHQRFIASIFRNLLIESANPDNIWNLLILKEDEFLAYFYSIFIPHITQSTRSFTDFLELLGKWKKPSYLVKVSKWRSHYESEGCLLIQAELIKTYLIHLDSWISDIPNFLLLLDKLKAIHHSIVPLFERFAPFIINNSRVFISFFQRLNSIISVRLKNDYRNYWLSKVDFKLFVSSLSELDNFFISSCMKPEERRFVLSKLDAQQLNCTPEALDMYKVQKLDVPTLIDDLKAYVSKTSFRKGALDLMDQLSKNPPFDRSELNQLIIPIMNEIKATFKLTYFSIPSSYNSHLLQILKKAYSAEVYTSQTAAASVAPIGSS